MATPERRFTFNLSFLLLIASGLAFLAALLVAESILDDFGLWTEWVAAGLALHVLAELV